MDITIPIDDASRRGELYGTADCHLRLIRASFGVRISARDNTIHVSGPDEAVQKAVRVVDELQTCLSQSRDLTEEFVHASIDRANAERRPRSDDEIDVFLPTSITPKGEGQRRYVEAIDATDLTFCLGPAGTGKTYLAVAVSVAMLKHHKIKRIVLVRPAVEAGEKLGYLPGDLRAKVNPYLRPLFDAMHDMMSFDQVKRLMQNDVIEVIPLAFMRGRTLNNAAIILDEAQNATIAQMLMFLTRLGHSSKMIVTGDDSQSDLDGKEPSGFVDAAQRLGGIEGISVVRLTSVDIVRHPLVQKVVEAYGPNGAAVR